MSNKDNKVKVFLNEEKRLQVDINNNSYTYKLRSMSIRKQKDKIFPVLNGIFDKSKRISNLFSKLFLNYITTKNENQLYKDFIELKWAIREYIKQKNVFKDVEKHQLVRRKTDESNIFFDLDETIEILYCSFYLKFYLLFYMTELKPSQDSHNKIFSNLLQALSKKGILSKLYKLIQIKVFASVVSDKPFWQYLKFVKGDSPETTCISTYVNILELALPMLDHNQNPITFLVVYAKNVVDYIFISAYQDTFFYESMFYYDTSEVYKAKEEDIMQLIGIKTLIEKTITPIVSKNYGLSIEKAKKLSEINPLIKIVAIPFFARLTNTSTSLYRHLNMYYLYTIAVYVAGVLKKLGLNEISKTLPCSVKQVKKKRNPMFTKKQKIALKENMAPIIQELNKSFDYLKQVTATMKNIAYFNVNTDVLEPMQENKLIEELVSFYGNLFTGHFNFVFEKLVKNNFEIEDIFA